jgi:xylulose-5-phosphate/fructose-6-phosphate phosphoketolase
MRYEAYNAHEPLNMPEWEKKSVQQGKQESCMKVTGEFLHDVIEL